MKKWQFYVLLALIYLIIWFVPPVALSYYLYYFTNIYFLSGYSFESVTFAMWAVWTIVFVFIAWILSEVLEGMMIGEAIVEKIQQHESRELQKVQELKEIKDKLGEITEKMKKKNQNE
jgi:ABC-type multidrug transport system fused ATPase/permease subunit